MAETVEDCLLPVELKFLEAEYDRSKFMVLQDKLICQKSILELDLLCREEELQRKAQSNARLTATCTDLEVRIRSLEEEATDARDLLKCAEQALEKEKNQRKTKEKDFRRKFEADLKRKLNKERHEFEEGVKADILREMQQWKEKCRDTCRQVQQLEDKLHQKNRKSKDKGTQVEISESEGRLTQKRVHPATELGQSESLSPAKETLKEHTSSCDNGKQEQKTLPNSTKDKNDVEIRSREMRGKKIKTPLQAEERVEQESQYSGYEASSSQMSVEQEKERVTRKQQADCKEGRINLLESVPSQDIEDMDDDKEEEVERGRKEKSADVSGKSERKSDKAAEQSLPARDENRTDPITEGFSAQFTRRKPQAECKSPEINDGNRKTAKINQSRKAGTKTLEEREAKERETNSSKLRKMAEETEHVEETKEKNTKGGARQQAEKKEPFEEKLKEVIRKDEHKKTEHVKETERNTKTKKVKQRQRKGQNGISSDQTKEVEEVKKAVKRQRRKAPVEGKSDEIKNNAAQKDEANAKEDRVIKKNRKDNSDKIDDYREKVEASRSHLRTEKVREKPNKRGKETKSTVTTDEVEKSAGEREMTRQVFTETRRPKRCLQKEKNNELTKNEVEKKILENSSRKRRTVIEEVPGDANSKKSRAKDQSPRQCVNNIRNDMKTAGRTRRDANPSPRPETGKTNNLPKHMSCGEAIAEKLMSTTMKCGESTLQAADYPCPASAQEPLLVDATSRVNCESENSGMNSRDASVEHSSEAHKISRKMGGRKPAPLKKCGKENVSKKRKTHSSTDAVAAKMLQASFPDVPSILNCTRRGKGLLFNARENSLMVAACAQESLVNTTRASQGQSVTGIPPRLSNFMQKFIAPKLLRSNSLGHEKSSGVMEG